MNRQCIQRCSAPPGPHLILALALLAPVLSFKPREVLARSTESGREAWAATSDPWLTSRGREPAIPGRPWTQCLGNPSTFQSRAAQPALILSSRSLVRPRCALTASACQSLPSMPPIRPTSLSLSSPLPPAGRSSPGEREESRDRVLFETCAFAFSLAFPHQFLDMNLGNIEMILKIRTVGK